MSLVITEKRTGYAILTLNRPEAMNALSRALRAALARAFEDCQADPDVRVLILTGRGKAFCAGMDLKEMGSSLHDNAAAEVGNEVARAMEAFEGPIIGAINGHAVTGGLELALACDVLIASERARFADTHARVGILPGWGLSQKLPRLIGLSRAREMSFTGAPVFAGQAREWGLVNHVVKADQLLDKATEMAENMCACVPQMLVQYKSLIDRGYSMPYREALQWEEQQSVEWARRTTPEEIEARRQQVLERGRKERDE